MEKGGIGLTELALCVVEAFTSPVWNSNFVLFAGRDDHAIPEENAKEYINRACRYAKHHQVYVVPERFFLQEYHCMCLIAPDGRVLGAQRALFRHVHHTNHPQGTDLEVITTEFGGITLCVDVDIFHPEVARMAASMGAQILICSQAISPVDYHSGMIVSGVWNAAQSNPLFVVGICPMGHCVCAPRALTKNRDGFLIAPAAKTPLHTKFTADVLAELPMRFCLSRRFYAIHRADLIGE